MDRSQKFSKDSPFLIQEIILQLQYGITTEYQFVINTNFKLSFCRIWKEGQTKSTICRRSGRPGKLSMVPSEFEITRSPSCGPNNNLCLDTKRHSSPSPSYLSLHQTTAEEYPKISPYSNPSINSKAIMSVVTDKDDTKPKENCLNNIKPDKMSELESLTKLENGK